MNLSLSHKPGKVFKAVPSNTSTKAARRKEKAGTDAEERLSPALRAVPASVLGVVFLFFAYRMFALIYDYAANIFFADQWDFDNATVFERHSLWQMFAWQHGPHRQGAGALLGWLIEPLFRWNSRTESFLVGGIITVAAIAALWLKHRLYGRFSYSDVIIPLIFFSPTQYDTLIGTANLAHGPLPLLFIVLYCIAWTCRRIEVRYGLALLINFVTIYTGFGIFLGLLTPLLVGIDYWVNLRDNPRGRLYLLAGLGVSLASLGSFFIGYRLDPAVDCISFQIESLFDYAWFAALMFAPSFGAVGTEDVPTVIGAIALGLLLVALAVSAVGVFRKRTAEWARHAVIATLAAYCLLFCANTAYGRLCLGVRYAQMSRYFIYVGLGLLGVYLCLLSISRPILRRAVLAVFCVGLVGSTIVGERMRPDMARIRNTKNGWKNCYLAVGDLGKCNEYARVYPWEPEKTHLQEKLDFLKKNRLNLFADTK